MAAPANRSKTPDSLTMEEMIERLASNPTSMIGGPHLTVTDTIRDRPFVARFEEFQTWNTGPRATVEMLSGWLVRDRAGTLRKEISLGRSNNTPLWIAVICSPENTESWVLNGIRKTYSACEPESTEFLDSTRWRRSLHNIVAEIQGDRRLIEGLRCSRLPLRSEQSGNVIGYSWISDDLAVVLEENFVSLHAQYRWRLINVVNDVPPAGLFHLPPDFSYSCAACFES